LRFSLTDAERFKTKERLGKIKLPTADRLRECKRTAWNEINKWTLSTREKDLLKQDLAKAFAEDLAETCHYLYGNEVEFVPHNLRKVYHSWVMSLRLGKAPQAVEEVKKAIREPVMPDSNLSALLTEVRRSIQKG
jgi:hypothetical protein